VDNVGQYLLGELQHVVEAIAGRQPLARNNGDPTLPAYFTMLALSAVLFLIHSILRGLGRVGVMPGRSLWRWSAVHAVVSALWVASVVYPQVFLVGWGIVHRAWASALAGYALQFLVAMTMLSRKTG
jgi:hypothetical protein